MNKNAPPREPVTLASHPRLLASADDLARLAQPAPNPLLRSASRTVAREANAFAASRQLGYDPDLHNALLIRAREMQRRVITLLVRWKQTGRALYRQAALKHVREMGAWTYWSSDRERDRNPDPNADFDLSYGENSATLALAYDWLHESLTPAERKSLVRIAVSRSLVPFLAQTEESAPAWWLGHPQSNWNSVCVGGAGMLALAMHGEFPESAEVLRRVERSLAAYMRSLEEMEGGWAEGIGYWNYGHRYAFWYLLSHCRAAGTEHPLLGLPGVRRTLEFPLDFCPHGQPCSFGDVNRWRPLAFHYAAAAHLGRLDLVGPLDRLLGCTNSRAGEGWPNEAELLVFHPRIAHQPHRSSGPVTKFYPKLDWAIMADRLPDSRLYLSIRGGEGGWDVPHGQLDQLSFHAVVGAERLIDNISIDGGDEYLDTTFSERRFELYETTPGSKNTLLINGVGVRNPSRVSARPLFGSNWRGVHIDATEAMNFIRLGASTVRFCARLFLLLEGSWAVILDRVELPNPGRAEARLHTFSTVRLAEASAAIRGRREHLQLAFASTVPAVLQRAIDPLTKPGKSSTMLRWCTVDRTHTEITFATLLAPGQEPAALALQEHSNHFLLTAAIDGRSRRLRIAKDLGRVAPLRPQKAARGSREASLMASS